MEKKCKRRAQLKALKRREAGSNKHQSRNCYLYNSKGSESEIDLSVSDTLSIVQDPHEGHDPNKTSSANRLFRCSRRNEGELGCGK